MTFQKTKRMLRGCVALVFSAAMLCGCQPTPEEPIVVNKNDGKLEEKIEQSNMESEEVIPLELPEVWTETFPVADNVTITVDTPIEGGGLAAYPVAEARAKVFSEEQMERFLQYFAEGKKFFANEETKADVERLLIEAKQGTEIDGEIVPPDPDDPYIKELEEKIASMPEDSRKYIDFELMDGKYGMKAFHAGVELDDQEDAQISITAKGIYGTHSYMGFNRGNTMGETIAGYNNITLEEPSVPKEEAIAMAEKALSELGFSDMTLVTIMKAELNPVNATSFAGMHSTYASKGYLMTFLRNINGMAMVDISDGEGGYSYSSSNSANYQPAYRAPWAPEYIMIYADENGVQNFSYKNCMEVTEVTADNVQLMPLEEISEHAMKQLYYKNADFYQEFDRVEIAIDKVVLGGSMINKKNDLETGVIVPAWHLFYSATIYDDGLKDGSIEESGDVLVINAIDGSVIDALYTPSPKDE